MPLSQEDWNRILKTLRMETDCDDSVAEALNAARELEDRADEGDIPAMERLAEDDNFFVVEMVGCAYAKLTGVRRLPQLLRFLDRGCELGHDCDSLSAQIWDVIEGDMDVAKPALLSLLKSPSERERENAARFLGMYSDALPALQGAITDPSPKVRAAAVGSLPRYAGREDVFETLVALLHREVPEVRSAAASSMFYSKNPRALAVLNSAKDDPDENVRYYVRDCIKRLTAPESGGGCP